MRGRLNVFQKSMLQWNELHPYNAVHVAWIPSVLDLPRLRKLIATVLEAKGLTGLALNLAAGTYEYEGGLADVELKVLTASAGVSPGYVGEIELQLNTPFVLSKRFSPFRFFVVAETDAFALALVYFHPIADAESIVLLLTELADIYRGKTSPGARKPASLYPPRRDNLLRFHPGVLTRRLATLPALIRQTRRACRPHYRDAEDLSNQFAFFSLSPSHLAALIRTAKSLEVSLNDLFLALLAKAVSCLAPARAGRRKGISLGCIVNLRKDLDPAARSAFGLLLGSFVVQHDVPAGISLPDLARQIGQQTARIKRGRLYFGGVLELAMGRRLVALFPLERRKRLYQKHYPLWGGLTNMNLNQLWPEAHTPGPVDYFRAVSTGPVTPLVLSISTLGEKANVGVSYRPAVFSAGDIEQIKSQFLEPMDRLVGRP